MPAPAWRSSDAAPTDQRGGAVLALIACCLTDDRLGASRDVDSKCLFTVQDLTPQSPIRWQTMNTPHRDPSTHEPVGVEQLRSAILSAIVQQVIAILLASLLLDGGTMLRLATISAVGSWTFILAIITRAIVLRNTKPLNNLDVRIIRGSLWLAAGITMIMCLLFQRVL